MKKFKVETKTAGRQVDDGIHGYRQERRRPRPYTPKKGKANVRFVRFTMLSNYGDPLFMDVMEFTVRGK